MKLQKLRHQKVTMQTEKASKATRRRPLLRDTISSIDFILEERVCSQIHKALRNVWFGLFLFHACSDKWGNISSLLLLPPEMTLSSLTRIVSVSRHAFDYHHADIFSLFVPVIGQGYFEKWDAYDMNSFFQWNHLSYFILSI